VSGKPVHVLFLNRSYWPDVEATGQLLTELCSDLARSHRVAVIAGRPNFVEPGGGRWPAREMHEGVEIVRVGNPRFSKRSLLGRAVGLLGYLLLAGWAAFWRRRPDVIVVETDPPLLGLVGAALKAWHRCRLVFYLQDLYPEVGLALGKLKPGLLTRLLRWATQVGLRRADHVVVLGEDMRRRVLARGIDPRKLTLIPNWVDTTQIRPLAPGETLRRTWELDGDFVVMYSGNLGLSQGLEQVLAAARQLRDEPVRVVLVGEGAAKAELLALKDEWGLVNVQFRPYEPKERLGASLGTADLHLIPMRRGLAGCIVPSKLYGILAAGRPYVACVDADSEVALVTQAEGTGLLIEPEGAQRLAEAIRWCLGHPDELREMARRGRRLAEECFDRRVSVAAFREMLERVVARGAGVAGAESAKPRGGVHRGVEDSAPATPPVSSASPVREEAAN
jgi:glycosyltransferase involved in cell wall biosynthesis